MSANRPSLSDIYMITGNYEGNKDAFLSKIEVALDQGIKMLQLRSKDMDLDEYDKLAEDVSQICKKSNCSLILNRKICANLDFHFDGFHLTSKLLMDCDSIDKDIREKYTFSAPVHNEQELKTASQLGIDFAIITPIQQSISYPDASSLGWEKAMDLASITEIPLYAAGGMRPEHLHEAKTKGFVGIATLGGIWQNSLS